MRCSASAGMRLLHRMAGIGVVRQESGADMNSTVENIERDQKFSDMGRKGDNIGAKKKLVLNSVASGGLPVLSA